MGGLGSLVDKFTNSEVAPKVDQKKSPKQGQNLNTGLAKGEIIMEFSPDTFKTPLLDEELNSAKDISIGESTPNSEGLQ